MRTCIPTKDGGGLEAVIHDHFGSAPFFVIVDTDSDKIDVIANTNSHHAHGTCHPLSQLSEHNLDSLVVNGIGRRALDTLHQAGIRAYKPAGTTVGQTIPALRNGELKEIDAIHACGGHHVHGSSHGGRGRGRGAR